MTEDTAKSREREHARSSARGGTDERPAVDGHREVTVRMPSLGDVRRGITPERVVWYGGLGALAAFGVIEWPVAAVAAAGMYVATRPARHEAGAGSHSPGG